MSPGAVSQQVTRCEAALGMRLFDRQPGGMVPVAGAAEIFQHLTEGFAALNRGVELTQRDRAQVLTVSAAPIFTARWLVWRLPAFYRAHPDIRVRIDSDISLADPNAGDIDLAIRIGPGGYARVRAEPLMDQRVTPVCHADLAAGLRTPADLARLPIIRDTRAMFDWDTWLAPEGLSRTMLGPGPEFNEAALCLDAAMTGAGVFLAFETLCRDALDRGQIVAPFPRWRATGLRYWLVSAGNRSLSPAERAFRTWLTETIAAERMGLPPGA